MNSQFDVCHYNTEQREDYWDWRPTDLEEGQRNTASLAGQASVYCYQGAYHVSHFPPLLSELQRRTFQVITDDRAGYLKPGAIAVDRMRFTQITNHTFSHETRCRQPFGSGALMSPHPVLIASATDVVTGQRFTFVSPKPLDPLSEPGQQKVYYDAIMQQIATVAPDSIQIIGLDSLTHQFGGRNDDIEEHFHATDGVFIGFSKEGFQLHSPDEPTKFQHYNTTLVKGDGFLTKVPKKTKTFWEKIKSLFRSAIQWTAEINSSKRLQSAGKLDWDVQNNPSQHRPIFITVQIKPPAASRLSRLWNYITKCGRS